MDLENGRNQQPIENVPNESQPQTSDLSVVYYPSTRFSPSQCFIYMCLNYLPRYGYLTKPFEVRNFTKHCEDFNPLLLALHLGLIDLAWEILEALENCGDEAFYKRVVLGTNNEGNNWPLVAARGLWGRDSKEYLKILRRFGKDSKLCTVKNEYNVTALMLLFKHESDLVTSNIGQDCLSDLRNHSLDVNVRCALCHEEESGKVYIKLTDAGRADVKDYVNKGDWRFEKILEQAGSSQWDDMKVLVDALPLHEDMQPLLESLLRDNKTLAFQRMLKDSAVEVLGSLLNKIQCVRCLKRTLLQNYWKKRFNDLKMPQGAIKAFDDAGLCTESYLIPKPSDDPTMSRPLAMMFYNEGDGEDIETEKDAKTLGKAFRDLGWPECSIHLQPRGFKWSCDQLLDEIQSQLKSRVATPSGGPVFLVVLFMPLLIVLPMFLLGTLLMSLMMILQIVSLVILKCYGWCFDSYADSWCYSCSWWWSYSLYYWWFMVYSFVCWLLYRSLCRLPLKPATVGSKCIPNQFTTNTTNKTSATNTTNATNCSLFVLSISAHGSAGMISGHHGTDGKIDNILELVDELLPSFIPKVIIIDACQNELPWPVPNPGVYTIRPNMLLLMATVRGEYSRGGRYSIYLAKEIEIGNDSLQNMHYRAALNTMSHKKEAKDGKRNESPPDQVAVSQSTTAKQIFLRNFNHTDRCHKKDCKVSDDNTDYVTCFNCPAMYHVVCIAKERYEKRENLALEDLPTLEKCGVQWFCTKCEGRFVML